MNIFNILFCSNNVGHSIFFRSLGYPLAIVKSISALLLSLFMLSSCASQYNVETSAQLLEKNPNLATHSESRLDFSMLDSNKNWSSYNEIYIAPATIAFSERWLKDNRTKVSTRYVEMIKEDYAKLLKKSLSKVIGESKTYLIVDKASPNSMTLEAKLEDLIIYGPETIARSTSFVSHAGIATFYAEIKLPDGSVSAAFKDRRETNERGLFRPERTSRVFNYHDFRLLMEHWAVRMKEDMDR